MTKIKEIRIEIFGRVQGVRFREFSKKSADRLDVKGYVRNRADGSVLIVGQAGRKVLEDFLDVVRRGNLLSRVGKVSYLWKECGERYEDFEIITKKGFVGDQKDSFVNLGKTVFGVKEKVPKHIAIIPDGNRRWARDKGMIGSEGHKEGASYDRLFGLFEEAKDSGVKNLTLWIFSTDNWKRDKKEVDRLFNIINGFVEKLRKDAKKYGIKFKHIGRKDRLPMKLMKSIEVIEGETSNNDKFGVQLCIDYGGRDEIVRAINELIKNGKKEVCEDDLALELDSYGIPDPDLVIRTSGEKRLSGFMPFQSTYSEFYFVNMHFPDFDRHELRKAIEEFGRRKRTFGGNA